MKNLKKSLGVLFVIAMLFAFVGCSKENVEDQNTTTITETSSEAATTEAATEEATEATTDLSGTVAVSGSTSVEKIGTAEAEEFMALNPNVTVTYESIGSSAGIKNAHENVTPIGTSSRELKEEEKGWGMKEVVIAYDGIAAIVHPTSGVAGLTKEQLLGIYNGTIKNWSEVGGADNAIVVVSREDGSGTRDAFEELVGYKDALTADALIAEGNGNVQTTVAGNPQAIGYVSVTFLDETVKALPIDSVEPTIENVLNSTYTISRPFLMVYHEENMNDATNAFIDFILSDEGQAIVSEKGGIPLK
ncbi:MAG: phosphate ABC transporter substrate-binding protein [Vallitaleaceae bacterium]|nr:phosphate ABC transporter substrate-binding protein [Vallitaleaceae bacterium]